MSAICFEAFDVVSVPRRRLQFLLSPLIESYEILRKSRMHHPVRVHYLSTRRLYNRVQPAKALHSEDWPHSFLASLSKLASPFNDVSLLLVSASTTVDDSPTADTDGDGTLLDTWHHRGDRSDVEVDKLKDDVANGDAVVSQYPFRKGPWSDTSRRERAELGFQSLSQCPP